MKPSKTPAALLHRLAARLSEESEERHREYLARVAPVQRFACEQHQWHPPGPGTQNMAALGGLCPICYQERRQREREQQQPEVKTAEIGLYDGSLYAQRAWEARKQERMATGEVFANTPVEREALRWLDNARQDEIDDLRETAADRRRTHAAHWGRRLGVQRRRRYVPHPARAGG